MTDRAQGHTSISNKSSKTDTKADIKPHCLHAAFLCIMDGESDSFCVSTVLNFRVSYVGQSTEAALKLLSVLEVLEDLFKMSSCIMFIDDVQCLLVGLSLKKQHFNEFI